MKLEPTGERMIVDEYRDSPERYLIYLFHMVTYRFASEFVEGKRVLDYGCGSGYGTHLLSSRAQSITGVDVAPEAVAHAQSAYTAPNLAYRTIDPDAPLPFADASFDVVLSFQVFEHVRDTARYLAEIDRVLAPGGVLLLVTPDRATRLLPFQRPWNRFHLREYRPDEIRALLAPRFGDIRMLGMGGTPDVLAIEIDRCTRTKWLTLPFTLPVMPDAWRVAMLDFIHRNRKTAEAAPTKPIAFGEPDVRIADDISPSVNIVAVARKARNA